MGCSESKIKDNVKSLNQCKERIACMKQSLSAHAAFTSAHSAYASALKNTGAALSDYTQSELQSPDDPSPHPETDDGILAWDFFVMLMEDGCGIEKPVIRRKVVKNQSGHGGGEVVEEGAPPSSMKEDMRNVNFLKVFKKLDDGFIKASESVCEVSKIHEANNLDYHSNFEDNQDQIKHPTKVKRVANSAKVDFSSKEKETQAALLEKMLAWEKKLYDQTKVGEMMKYEYQKEVKLLNKLRKQGSRTTDRTKRTEAAVNDLHTRCIVEMQSIDSTVLEINRLRDEQLYPKLVKIVEKMEEMWKNMQKQHEQQLTIVQRLSNIKISQLPKDTTEQNLKNIEQIHHQVTIGRSEFEKLMQHQREYIKSLNNWLKVNLISTDHNLKPQNPKIEPLLRTWSDLIEKLPEKDAKTAVNTFGSVIATIVQYHQQEMKIKARCDEIRRKITMKSQKFEEWCDKQISKRIPGDVMDDIEVIAEKHVVMEVLKMWLEKEEEVYRRFRVQVKDTAVKSLKTALPEVFMEMKEFSGACLNMYGSLKSPAKTKH